MSHTIGNLHWTRVQFVRWALCLSTVVTLCAGVSLAQLPVPTSSQFDVTGFLQSATLDTPGDPHSGGTLMVNNHLITVPRETIVIFPANALSWQEIFAKAPAPWGIPGNLGVTTTVPSTGMAVNDCANNTSPCTAPPLTTYEFNVIGNRVTNAVGGDQYIAGLIFLSQQSLNSGAGFVNFIDYTNGEMRVGGIMGNSTTGARVRINDPMGRYGRNSTSPDVRFTVDPDNPTVMAGSGYPMCLPRTAPTISAPGLPNLTTDSLCPEENRPVGGIDVISGVTSYVPNFTTANLTSTCAGTCVPAPPGTWPDSTKQAPIEVGDYITYAGNLMKDPPAGGFTGSDGPTVGPMPSLASSTYIAAHTITDNIAIYTFAGSDPAYVMADTTILGTGGLTVLGAGEAAIRTRFEGMTTDFSRQVHLYGIDVDPKTGATSDRDWGFVGVDPGPAGGVGAVQGRWRFRPPCLDFGTIPTKPDKQCVYGPTGTFLPPTREFRAVIEGLQSQNPSSPTAITAANGLFYGQYHAPILEYIFPENVPGSPVVPNNFEAMPFLAQGGYSSSGIPDGNSIVALQLSPWPGASAPTATCAAPTVNAGGPYTAPSGGTLTLAGSATGTGPFTYLWTVASGTLSDATLPNPVFTAPNVATQTTVAATLTVTGSCGGSVTASTSITVNAAQAPTVAHIAPQTVISGTPVTLTTSATDPQGLSVTFQWLQTGGTPVVFNPNPVSGPTVASGASASAPQFNVILPIGAPSTTLTFQVTATNSAGVTSAPETTSVTVNPSPDIITVTTAQYRTSKQRLDLTVNSSVISPNVTLTLQPYLTEQGTTFDPSTLGNSLTNTGGGVYTMTLVGAPRPACSNANGTYATPCQARPIIVNSNLGGQSAPTALTSIRQ